jgi:Tfp pilus assembly major pilin PilA
MSVNPTGSAPVTSAPPESHRTAAYSRLPLPRVAMNESICANSTSSPLNMPISAPSSSTNSTTTCQGNAVWTCRYTTTTCSKPSPYPMDRSNLPVAMGSVAPSASNALTDRSLVIERTLSQVGKVSGRRSENSRNNPAATTSRP